MKVRLTVGQFWRTGPVVIWRCLGSWTKQTSPLSKVFQVHLLTSPLWVASNIPILQLGKLRLLLIYCARSIKSGTSIQTHISKILKPVLISPCITVRKQEYFFFCSPLSLSNEELEIVVSNTCFKYKSVPLVLKRERKI